MYILGIETSTKTGSVAIVSEQGVVAQYSLNIEVTHSERLMATVDRVLRDTGLTMSDMDGFAVAIGPGSFTGLRIGLATVKGLALATNRPVAGGAHAPGACLEPALCRLPVCPLLDARKNEVYAALYEFRGSELCSSCPNRHIPIKTCGGVTGSVIFSRARRRCSTGRRSKSSSGSGPVFAPLAAIAPFGAPWPKLGLAMIRSGRQADPDNLTPLYVRRPEAEVAWEKRQQSR